MKKYCFTLKVHPEKIQSYRNYHEEVWPEMLLALKASGWKNYSLFLNSEGLLIGTFETENLEYSVTNMSQYSVNTKWQETMSQFFMNDGNPSDLDTYTSFEEVFNLEEQIEALNFN